MTGYWLAIVALGAGCLGLIWYVGRLRADARNKIGLVIDQYEERLTRSKTTQRAVHVGSAAELFAPFLPNFPVLPTEARHYGSPFDYIGLKGLEQEGAPITIYFIEVKNSKMLMLSERERRIRDAVQAKRVEWVLYDARKELS